MSEKLTSPQLSELPEQPRSDQSSVFSRYRNKFAAMLAAANLLSPTILSAESSDLVPTSEQTRQLHEQEANYLIDAEQFIDEYKKTGELPSDQNLKKLFIQSRWLSYQVARPSEQDTVETGEDKLNQAFAEMRKFQAKVDINIVKSMHPDLKPKTPEYVLAQIKLAQSAWIKSGKTVYNASFNNIFAQLEDTARMQCASGSELFYLYVLDLYKDPKYRNFTDGLVFVFMNGHILPGYYNQKSKTLTAYETTVHGTGLMEFGNLDQYQGVPIRVVTAKSYMAESLTRETTGHAAKGVIFESPGINELSQEGSAPDPLFSFKSEYSFGMANVPTGDQEIGEAYTLAPGTNQSRDFNGSSAISGGSNSEDSNVNQNDTPSLADIYRQIDAMNISQIEKSDLKKYMKYYDRFLKSYNLHLKIMQKVQADPKGIGKNEVIKYQKELINIATKWDDFYEQNGLAELEERVKIIVNREDLHGVNSLKSGIIAIKTNATNLQTTHKEALEESKTR